MDPRFDQVAASLTSTRMAAVICDVEWRVVWLSEEIKALLGEQDEAKLGIGRHLMECWASPTWMVAITDESRFTGGVINWPFMAATTLGGVAALTEMLPEEYRAVAGELQMNIAPEEPPALWANKLEFIHRDLPPEPINQIFVRLHDDLGHFGYAIMYDQGLPARLVALVARGDEGMFERMARLFDPGRRAAAILFADLEASAYLARKLSSAAYFQLIRAIITTIDAVVVKNKGIVARHAGDGGTAFFLPDDCGSPSAAALAAIRSAREIHHATMETIGKVAQEVGAIEQDCPMRVGLHWGPNLYMGQLITGGRLEVTALGDEVNECARIEQSAIPGKSLASKVLIEQLDPSDARTLELDVDAIRYTPLSEVAEATDKALRDAGSVAVTEV